MSETFPNVIINSEQVLYRIFSRKYFEELLKTNEMVLRSPRTWQEPFEHLPWRIQTVTHPDFLRECSDKYVEPIFAQCWTQNEESDTFWRAYSNPPSNTMEEPCPISFDAELDKGQEKEGVMVKTTIRKIIEMILKLPDNFVKSNFYLGPVRYYDENEIKQIIANRIEKIGLRALLRGRNLAELFLLKRKQFRHENEVRLMYIDEKEDMSSQEGFSIPFNPRDLFDEVQFDPRLTKNQVNEREDNAKQNYDQEKLKQSNMYQVILLEVIIKPK